MLRRLLLKSQMMLQLRSKLLQPKPPLIRPRKPKRRLRRKLLRKHPAKKLPKLRRRLLLPLKPKLRLMPSKP
jgi:hypothetical protein